MASRAESTPRFSPTMPGTLPADRSGIVTVKIFQAERARGSRLQLPF
jgi:hypothetical protein